MTERPQLRLEYIDASQLADNPSNWRLHNDAQIDGLKAVLSDVGWAGALLYNERTKRLIDGHARKAISEGPVPVLIGSWSEEDEQIILATLDPLAAMAEANEEALAGLLAEIETDSAGLQAMLDGLGNRWDIDSVDSPDLPSGDRAPIQQMTFTLSDEQAADVKRAVEVAKAGGPFVDTGNENSNGNALARIVEGYLGTC